MIDKEIRFKLTDRTHALSILPTDEYSKKSHIHPILVIANESGYTSIETIAFSKAVAQAFVDKYNREVLELSPAEAECIMASTMFPGVQYPRSMKKFEEHYKDWPSQQKQEVR
jgi:hypothetical protein